MGDRAWLVLVSEDRHGAPQVERLAALLPSVADLVDLVVLRWKQGAARTIVDSARAIARLNPRPPVVLSERFDLARTAGVEGVQLSEEGLDPQTVRTFWPGAILGVSRHDEEGVEVRSLGSEFVLLSPVFETPSKPGHPGMGLARFARIAKSNAGRVVALGGVDLARVPALLQAGAGGVAVRTEVFGASDPVWRVRDLRRALDSATPPPPDDEFVPGSDGGVRAE